MKHNLRTLSPGLRRLFQAAAPVLVSFLQSYQLHYSAVDGYQQYFQELSLPVILLNVALLLWLNLGAKLLLQKWHLALGLTALLTTTWSMVNFFVLKFHGSPLLFSEFANFRTAMNVVDGYRFVWERRLTWLLALGLAELGTALLLWLVRDRQARFWDLKELLLSGFCFAGVTLLLWLSLFVWELPKPRSSIGWNWRKGVRNYGYAAIILEDVDRSIHDLKIPEGYDPAHLDAVPATEAAPLPEIRPDILLIVNETFCDLTDYLDFTADVDPLAAFYGIEGAVYGKAAITSVGGGTNNTEFEVLTSCSLHVLTRAAPFNYLNLNRVDVCAPRCLKTLGYASMALHCESGSNYSRNRAYPAMGFDRVIMGRENFLCRANGARMMLDEDNYADMLRYAETLGEGPRFVYLLTYQNHGGWEKNDDALDTVHVREDFGGLTDDLNEYLSSLQRSAAAFRALTETLAASERPTVVLMLGDHAPSFLSSLEAREGLSELEAEAVKRMVPFVIWANFDLEIPARTDYASAVDLLPMVFQALKLPTSAFQNALLALHEALPYRTLNSLYLDGQGGAGRLEESAWAQAVDLYYELEYNALNHGSDYRRDLFVCPE